MSVKCNRVCKSVWHLQCTAIPVCDVQWWQKFVWQVQLYENSFWQSQWCLSFYHFCDIQWKFGCLSSGMPAKIVWQIQCFKIVSGKVNATCLTRSMVAILTSEMVRILTSEVFPHMCVRNFQFLIHFQRRDTYSMSFFEG